MGSEESKTHVAIQKAATRKAYKRVQVVRGRVSYSHFFSYSDPVFFSLQELVPGTLRICIYIFPHVPISNPPSRMNRREVLAMLFIPVSAAGIQQVGWPSCVISTELHFFIPTCFSVLRPVTELSDITVHIGRTRCAIQITELSKPVNSECELHEAQIQF